MSSDTNMPKARKDLMKYIQATGEVYQGGKKPESGLFLSIFWAFIWHDSYKLSIQNKTIHFNTCL